MVACAPSEEEFVVTSPATDATALDFAAYVTRYGRSTGDNITDVKALAVAGGFGVIGYTTGQRKFDDYVIDVTVPTFLVNQQVYFCNDDDDGDDDGDGDDDDDGDGDDDDEGRWMYEPVKYFDNNDGARHSFFAYAPYRQDADIVYATGMAPQVRHDISRDIDLLWAAPTKDMLKPAVDEKVVFHFSHALTKTTFHVAPFVDRVHSDDKHAEDDNTHPITEPLPLGTTVRVRSIHLNGTIPYSGLMNTEDGKWTPGTTRQYYDVPGASAASWTGNGTADMGYHEVTPSVKLIPTQKVSIEVIYDVISQANGITQHVTRKAVSQETFDLMQGKSYNIYLDLGLNSVKFLATVGDWTDDGQNVVLPDLDLDPILLETVLTTILPWQSGVIDGDDNENLHW